MVVNDKTVKILAKPSGITLEKHVSNVMSEAKYIENSRKFVFEKYENIIGKPLSRRLELACKYHDEGKAGKWQEACFKDYQNFIIWQQRNNSDFIVYEKAVGRKAGENIMKASVRHEFDSLKILRKKIDMPPQLKIIVETAIAAHHSKLSYKEEERWDREKSSELFGDFKRYSYSVSEKKTFEEVLLEQYKFSAVRGLLQFADRRASARESKDYVPNLIPFKYTFPHKEKRGVQNLIEKHWQEDLLLVRAPTGAGKTDASLLWASLQIKNKRADRMIIAMPTRFTSNALSINVAETLSETGLYHSSAWFTKFKQRVDDEKIKKNIAVKEHDLARLLQTPITVCTIDHLLIALTLSREDHHQISFNLANSCVVIDEADFYDDFTQANILILLEALKIWKVPVLLMSASLPESVLSEYQKIGFNAKEILEDNSDSERDRFSIETIKEYKSIDEIENLLELCVERKAAIIYANTVDKAMSLYEYFEKRKVKSIVYHSRFTEPDKKLKEEELIACLGKNAWEQNKAEGIAILTQIGEMSINISADLMISELCPIDRLTQRAGRICRFDKNKVGQLHIIIPQKDGAIYPAPYGSFDRKEKRWIPVDSLLKTQNIICKKRYNPSQLVLLLNDIYSKSQEKSAIAMSNAKMLKDHFIMNWLISPAQQTDKDDSDTNFWRSRNIGSQDTVLTEIPESKYFKSYQDYQEWKLVNGISLPVYLIQKYIKKNILIITPVYIYDNEEKVYVIKNGFYDFEKGISIPDDDPFW